MSNNEKIFLKWETGYGPFLSSGISVVLEHSNVIFMTTQSFFTLIKVLFSET